MNHKPTKKQHYNPCFWTAYWNTCYYEQILRGEIPSTRARDQRVYSLNIISDSIRLDKTRNVHVESDSGEIEITHEDAKRFVKKYKPEEYKEFVEESDHDRQSVYMDSEQLLSNIEFSPSYATLLNVINRQTLTSREDKAFTADFIYLQWLRSHVMRKAILDYCLEAKISRFEYEVLLHWRLSGPHPDWLLIRSLAISRWTLFRTTAHAFPLADSPILVQPKSIMIALSPRLMLEITPGRVEDEEKWDIIDGVSYRKLWEFRDRTIRNTFREIIFSDEDTLRKWQGMPQFKSRRRVVSEGIDYKQFLNENTSNSLWVAASWYK